MTVLYVFRVGGIRAEALGLGTRLDTRHPYGVKTIKMFCSMRFLKSHCRQLALNFLLYMPGEEARNLKTLTAKTCEMPENPGT